MRKKAWMLLLLLFVVTMLSACEEKLTASGKPQVVRVGVFKNVTHAAAYIALENGYFAREWGNDVKIEVTAFDNGSDLSIAMATGDIDVGFVGPGPATTFFLKSGNYRVVSGSNNGGAVLVARNGAGINGVKDLVDKTIAIPSKGNTNEISLRMLLQQEGISLGRGAGSAHLIVRSPSDALISFRQKEIDAALVPEPWGTQIERAGLGKVVVDWQAIPPNHGDYPTVIMVASDKLIERHRDIVKGAIKANMDGIAFIQNNPEQAYELINNQLKQYSGKGMDKGLIKASLSRLRLTTDVDVKVMEEMARVSIAARYIKGIKEEELDLSKFVDLSMLEEVKKGK
ncbi:ABC transporter substrate-binding protein [Paenibacillus aceris]|uniref:NitT/TauT family transport system substrate-binding protein n=1 Tax=Paenibacillus aceris TaxID=869555 RepID=A0ABS4I2I6_9BACL|nr:ABC transporter substrate-binding protein [Paenibacillus aceris]MBP1965113.1 NitT/TauT family transport system substrate-binding protein [Paenibacillus aceris]NHW33095.1 ABC transporter substrate-binding protein [Paenibacillus aceris]